jgi:hypothetical protein
MGHGVVRDVTSGFMHAVLPRGLLMPGGGKGACGDWGCDTDAQRGACRFRSSFQLEQLEDAVADVHRAVRVRGDEL